MATTINLQIKVGNTINQQRNCPGIVNSSTPFITWTVPDGIIQRRFNIKITNLESGGGLFVMGEVASSDNFFQYPTSNPMTSKFYGLCSVEVAISQDSRIGRSFEYTSGDDNYLVFDDVVEIVYNKTNVECEWQNVYNEEDSQSVQYHLQLARSPIFEDNSLILDEMIPQNMFASKTFRNNIEMGLDKIAFWRVRAFDGMDYGDFSVVNGFYITDNRSPEISIDNILVTNNEYRDVIIDFTLVEYGNDFVYLEPLYIGGNAAQETPMSIINGLGRMYTGSHQIIWRSSRNEKLISADNYMIKLKVTDTASQSSQATSQYFSMDNSLIGQDTGGIGAVDIEFPIRGLLADVIEYDAPRISAPFKGYLESKLGTIKESSSVRGELDVFSCYYNGGIFKEFSVYDFYDNTRTGYRRVSYPPGASAGVNSRTDRTGQDLDSDDPDFARTLDYVDENGYYYSMMGTQKDYNDFRSGYLRFYKKIFITKSLCSSCSGRGWKKEELVKISDEKYKRVPCSVCNGNRFTPDSENELNNGTWYRTSEYRPLEQYFAPCNVVGTEGITRVSGNYAKIRRDPFLLGDINSSRYTDNTFVQRDAITLFNQRYDTYGMYQNFNIEGRLGDKIYHDSSVILPLRGLLGPESDEIKKHEFPLRNWYAKSKVDFQSGITDTNGVRPSPTHKWESGIWPMSGNYRRVEPLESLGFLYLQGEWNSYNTLHWKSTMSSVTRIHIQVARFFEDGSRTEYEDVISDFSDFNVEMNAHLVKPMMWHTFWDAKKQDLIEDGFDYRFRIRQCDLVSKTYSNWVYSSKFYIGENTPNPANIFNVVYEKWTKNIEIYFRLDDTQNDEYSIISLWYSEDGDIFKQINDKDIVGAKTNLSSTRGMGLKKNGLESNEHIIVWDASSYNLPAGDKYRIKIRVMPSKYSDDIDYPIFSWSKAYNPIRNIAESKVVELGGAVQKYIYDQNDNLIELDTPMLIPGRIEQLEYELEEFKKYPTPSGIYEFMAEDKITVINPSGYYDWLSHEVISNTTRNDIMLNRAAEINELRDELSSYKSEMFEQERSVRRDLIDQGYYCNGFIDNDEDNGIFKFYVISSAGLPVQNETGDFYQEYSERLEMYERFQLDFFSSFNSQNGYPLRDIFYDRFGDRIQGANETPNYIDVQATEDTRDSFDANKDYEYNFDPIDVSEDVPAGKISIYSDNSKPNQRSYHTFTLLKEDLPGEWSDKFIDNTRNGVSDTLPVGVASFDYKYKWRVATYNIVKRPPLEKPWSEINSAIINGSTININYKTSGDKDIQLADVEDIFYITEYDSSFNIRQTQDVSFDTDIDENIVNDTDYNYSLNWMPIGSLRTRPFIFKEDHNYFMWYTKLNNYGQNTIIHGRGKLPTNFGEYEMAIPSNMDILSKFIAGANNSYNSCVLKIDNVYHMWYTVSTSSGNKMRHSISLDKIQWSAGEELVGISGYSPFVTFSNDVFTIYYCQYDIASCIRKATSSDGVNFSGDQQIVGNGNNLDTPCVIKHNGEDIIFYTEHDGIDFKISNTRIDLFPEITGAKNPCVIEENFPYPGIYRIFYNVGSTIKTSIFENFTKKRVGVGTTPINYFVSGNYIDANSSVLGCNNSLSIMKDAHGLHYSYYCSSDYRLEYQDVLKYIFVMKNSLEEKEYYVQSAWLTEQNMERTDSTMSPETYGYKEIVKEIDYYRGRQ